MNSSPLWILLCAIVLGSLWVSDSAAQAAPACASGTGQGQSFAGQDMTNHNFSADPPGSLVGANFSNANLSGAIFADQDLTNARFDGARLGPSLGRVDFSGAALTNTCFVGATLDDTDFSFATITCANFAATSMINARFGPTQDIAMGTGCRTSFAGATLDVRMITTDATGLSNWGKVDFSRAKFLNLNASTFSLAGKDITGAMLAGIDFTNIDMNGANLTDVDFTQATLVRATLDNTALNGARFYNAQAASASFVCAQAFGNSGGQTGPAGAKCPAAPASINPTTGADFTFAAMKGADFTGATLDHVVFSAANLTGAHFDGASLVQASLQSTSSQSGPAIVQFATFRGARLDNAQLGGVDFSGGTLTDAVFDGANLTNASFANATMPGASFRSTTLSSVNFSAANLQSADFGSVTILAPSGTAGSGANFSCSQLGGADFSDATIAATNFSNAVMPDAAACCTIPGTAPSTWCGIVDATQQTYGPVTFPLINTNSNVTCPDGSTGQCSGTQWQLSANWQTTGCNKNGVSQQMWSRPDCSGTPTDIVSFADPNLKACILATLPGQTEVYLTTAQQIEEVICPGRGIAAVGGLETFSALRKLDLRSNALTIFTLVPQAGGKPAPSQLQTLSLDDNALTTLDLSAHPALTFLSVSDNQLGSILLNANAFLLFLDASHNRLQSVNLPIQTSLGYADLSHNLLSDVLNPFATDLGALQALGYLDLSHNVLTGIGSVASIAYDSAPNGTGNLKSLFLGCNPGFQCGTLDVYDGTRFPAAASSECSAYNTSSSTWTPLSTPACPPD